MTEQHQSYFAGSFGGSGTPLHVRSPADGSVLAEVATVTAKELAQALDAAADAFRTWRRHDPWARAAMLRDMATFMRDHRGEIAATITAEQGKPLAQAEGELNGSADHFDWFGDEARRIYGRTIPARQPDRQIMVNRVPVGVVGAFSASNFPCLLPARKISAALAAGCTVVAKPAEEAPLSALWIARAAEHAGIPAGVLNVLVGDPQQISDAILADRRVRKITLTGSVPLGKMIMAKAAETLKSVSLELGGHSPVIVLDDADGYQAGCAAATGKYRNAGQVCISPSRFLVPTALHDRFVAGFVDTTNNLCMGPGEDRSCDLGPLHNQRRVEAMVDMVDTAVKEGATVVAGGTAPDDRPDGWWFEPTVLIGIAADATIMSAEPFGPVAPIMAYDDLEEAIQIANATEFGLAAFVLGDSLARCLEVADQLEAGMVGVNDFSIALAEAPFGGVKASGFGREGGAEGIDAFTVTKYINVAPT